MEVAVEELEDDVLSVDVDKVDDCVLLLGLEASVASGDVELEELWFVFLVCRLIEFELAAFFFLFHEKLKAFTNLLPLETVGGFCVGAGGAGGIGSAIS